MNKKYKKKKVVMVSNTSWYMYNFRRPLIKYLIDSDYSVIIVAPEDKYSDKLIALGAQFYSVPISRHGKSFYSDAKFIYRLIKIYKNIDPDIIHHFTIKPVIYGSFASKFISRKVAVVNSITGLGVAFKKDTYFDRLFNHFIVFLYKISGNINHKVIFQNIDNMNTFLDKKIVHQSQCHLIKSSGVDINYFKKNGYVKSDNITRYGIMCRMLWSKGLKEFVDCAIKLHKQNPSTKFYILGSPDITSPDNVPESWLKDVAEKYSFINWQGHVDDVRKFLEKIDVFVLPSYYPEGVPRSLIEAGAMNLPLITTDTSGCKDVVLDGRNGYLVKMKNETDLYEKMSLLSKDASLRIKMGEESRKLVSINFNVNNVNKQTIEVYN